MMLNYLNTAIAIYLVISAGLFLYLHHLSEENIENHKRKLWFVVCCKHFSELLRGFACSLASKRDFIALLFFYFAACVFVIEMVVSASSG